MEKAFQNTILIVEDSHTQALKLKGIIERHEYPVETAEDGLSALDWLRHKTPLMVISDIVMPHMDGYTLCAEIRKIDHLKQTPVILLTALSEIDDVLKALACGANHFLTKPHDENLLISTIKDVQKNKSLCRPAKAASSANAPIECFINGEKKIIHADHHHTIGLLFSTYAGAIQKNKDLARLNKELVTIQKKLQHDLIERRKISAQLKVAKEQAEAANQAKSEFLANMSHEIRTPMNSLLGFTNLLKDITTDKTASNYVQAIHTSGKVLLTLINDILDLSKIEAGKMVIHTAAINPHALLDELKYTFYHKAEENGLNFNVNIDPELPTGLVLDDVRLRQVLYNLVGNAIKFTKKGEVTLTIEMENHNSADETLDLIIHVADTGIGFDMEDATTLFQPFTQLEGNIRRNYGGTGLGLTISKRLTEMMNGSITVTSQTGKGSTFTVTLQNIAIQTGGEGEAQEPIDPKVCYTFLPAKILIVDDIDYNRSLIKAYLKDHPIICLEAGNGQHALILARDNKPDLILMDIRMPIMDGFEATTHIKNDPELSHIKVLALTASVFKSQNDLLVAKGFDGALYKPITQQHLFTELAKYLAHQMTGSPERPTDKKNPPSTPQFSEILLAKLPEILKLLDSEIKTLWEKTIHSNTFDDYEYFGQRIYALGSDYDYKALKDLGQEMLFYTESCDIDQIEATLKKFPNLIDRLRLASKD